MCESCVAEQGAPAGRTLTRRRLLQVGLAATAAAVVPVSASAAPNKRPGGPPGGLVNPYSGWIPSTFPLAAGTYQTPVANNWHQSREGQQYAWTHRDSKVQRAHDGVDVYPTSTSALPAVYAPFSAIVSAVCRRSDNTLSASVTYDVDSAAPLPWDYSQAVDNVAGLPLYGNFVWLQSTAPKSTGYFAFYCHLQDDAVLQNLLGAVGQTVTVATRVGTMGDTGNAQGTPQLHVEVHYPLGHSFTCTHCSPRKSGVTAIDPFATLTNATPR